MVKKYFIKKSYDHYIQCYGNLKTDLTVKNGTFWWKFGNKAISEVLFRLSGVLLSKTYWKTSTAGHLVYLNYWLAAVHLDTLFYLKRGKGISDDQSD